MKKRSEMGGMKTGLGLWLLGVPIPFILIFMLVKGCAGA